MTHLTPEMVAKLEKLLNEGKRLEIAVENNDKLAILVVARKLIHKA